MRKISKKKTIKALKNAIRCIAFLCLLFFLIVRTYDVLSWKDTLGDYVSSVEQLYSTEDDMIDVVFTGSSHTYCSIAPAILWNEAGIAAFNMTTSGQDKDSTYHYLVELLKTQSPKVVFVELWGLTFDYHMVEGNVHRNMMGMPLSENSIALIDDYVVDEQSNTDYKLRWPIVHTRYKELEMYDFVQYDFSEYGRGSDLLYTSTPQAYPWQALSYSEVDKLSKSNKEWLEELYQLSVDEDFELVLFVAPTSVNTLQQGQINAAEAFATEHDLKFLDFNKLVFDMGIDYSSDFIDYAHLNGYGAEKMSLYVSEYISENFDLEDHSGDKDYYQWDDSYTRFVQVKETAALKNCTTFDVYIQQLQEMENITCYISFEGTYIKNIPSQSICWMLEMEDADYKAGGTFVYKDGELTKIMDNKSEEVYIEELDEYHVLKIQNMNLVDSAASSTGDIMINLDELVLYDNAVNFVVYDNFRNEVIDTRAFY